MKWPERILLTVQGATGESLSSSCGLSDWGDDYLAGSTVDVMHAASVLSCSLLTSAHLHAWTWRSVSTPFVDVMPSWCFVVVWRQGLSLFSWNLTICVAWLAREPQRNASLYSPPLVFLHGIWGLQYGLHTQTTVSFSPNYLLSPYHNF